MTIPVFLNIYKGLIRPHLEFCNQTWYPQLKQNTQLIENVQLRLTRMVQGLLTLSCNERLKKLELPSLEYRRRRGTMIELLNIGYNRYDPKATKDMFELNNRDTRTKDKKVITKKANFELRENVLPLDQLQIGTCCHDSKTLNAFMNNLDKHWKKRKADLINLRPINRKGVHHELIDRGNKTPKSSEKELN